MNATARRAAAVVSILIVAGAPSASASPAVPPGHVPWPPPSTHGAFVDYPADVNIGFTFPACGSDINVGPGDVFGTQYRAMVNDAGETVVEFHGDLTLDMNRLSDGAYLDELSVSGAKIEVHDPDGETVTYQHTGPAFVASSNAVEAQAFAEAGLPETFFFLSGQLTQTVTYETTPAELGQEIPPMLSAEITQDSTDYVFDVCQMLDAAPKDP